MVQSHKNSRGMQGIKNYRYRFEVNCSKFSSIGEDLYVSGNVPELGEWKPENAKKMLLNRDRWTLDLSLPSGSFEYKYFVKTPQGRVRWEVRDARVFNLERDHVSKKEEKIQKKSHHQLMEISFKDEWDSSINKVYLSRREWWKEVIVYQIYPRSFCDSNGDGIGDIRGVISKLDYLQELGVNVVWLSPVYQSPNVDNGYDISDYCAISQEFGTMEDWEEMIHEMHKRGIKLVMDLVVNHTSDQHYWFKEARKSKDNPYRDFYIWRPPNFEGKEPNNWKSFFGGSVWEFDEVTGDYYLHLFSKNQPDLNWENPAVRKEIFKMQEFWLKKGVDGFRMDVINVISKVSNYPDVVHVEGGAVQEKNISPYFWAGEYFVNGPRLQEFLREMKEKVLSKYDIFTVGETPFVGTEDATKFTDEDEGVVNMLFHFELMGVDGVPDKEKWFLCDWELQSLKDVMDKWQVELQGKGWNSLYLENHDQPRSVSRFGNDKEYHTQSAKMLATWLHMMQGTPYVYQGQEIGMTNVPFESINDYQDIESLNAYEELKKDLHWTDPQILKSLNAKSRDNARTPMQWNDQENAGFTHGKPWIKLNPNYKSINVEKSVQDPNSILSYYKKLIWLRKEMPIIVYGAYAPVLSGHKQIYSYTRELDSQKLLVICNFSKESPTFQLPEHITFQQKELLVSNYEVEDNSPIVSFSLRPYEARVYILEN